MLRLLALSSLFIALTGQALAVEAQRAVPARVVVPGLEKLVIVDRSNGWSKMVADEIATLSRRNMGFERGRVNVTPGIDTGRFEFARTSHSGPISGALARTKAERFRAQAVVDIRTSILDQTSTRFKRIVQRTVKNDEDEDETINVTVQCLRRRVRVKTSVNVLNAHGLEAGSWSYTRARSASRCDIPWRGESIESLPSFQTLLTRAFRLTTTPAAKTVLPYWESFTIQRVRDRTTRPILRRVDRPDQAVPLRVNNGETFRTQKLLRA